MQVWILNCLCYSVTDQFIVGLSSIICLQCCSVNKHLPSTSSCSDLRKMGEKVCVCVCVFSVCGCIFLLSSSPRFCHFCHPFLTASAVSSLLFGTWPLAVWQHSHKLVSIVQCRCDIFLLVWCTVHCVPEDVCSACLFYSARNLWCFSQLHVPHVPSSFLLLLSTTNFGVRLAWLKLPNFEYRLFLLNFCNVPDCFQPTTLSGM